MTRVLLFVLALAAAACSRAPDHAANACAHAQTREVVWTNADAPDTITASAQGPSCDQAVVLFVVRNASGDPLWTHASTYFDMTTGGGPVEGASPVTDADMQAFLSGWASVEISRSNELPEWREGVATLTESAQTFAYDTPFEREAYEMLRARALPTLCFAGGAESAHCLVIDPLSNAPTMIVAYGP
jgi:hypothetical protein